MASSKEELKKMSPAPMNTMLEKQSKTEAVQKRLDRLQIVTKDVPPTVAGIIFACCSLLV